MEGDARDKLYTRSRFSYSTFALGPSEAARYLDRSETLAPALAALMDPGELSPARHKLAFLRRIARAEVDDAGRFLLVNCVETYVQWDDEAEEEYEALLAGEDEAARARAARDPLR